MSAWCDQAKPFPFAPYVFVTEETTADDLRRYVRDIRDCGFDCLRFGGGEGGCGAKYLAEDRYDFAHTDLIFDLADEAGLKLIPNLRVGYGDWMGLAPHRVPKATHLIEPEYHRLIEKYVAAAAERYRRRPCLLAYEGVGEPGGFPEELEQDARFLDAYRAWLQTQYGTLEGLSRAWGYGGPLLKGLDSWDDWRKLRGMHFEKYRHRRDLVRFKTEFLAERMTQIERFWQKHDPGHPVLTGVHQLLGNVASQKWDFELQASRADGFFSSIHGGWHFWILPREFLLPLYVQARLTRDFAKGKWALPYETTGGPNFRSAIRQHNMTDSEHWQMMMCYLGAGLQGVGLWAWNCRLSGPEAGEYGMTTLQGTPSRRASLLGAFSRQAGKYREELYDAQADRGVAVLYSWESEMFSSQREMGRLDGWSGDENSRNRVGVARALVNRNIPFEFVTDNELVAGRADAYPVIVIPGMPVVRRDAMDALVRYVEKGGRVVADAPFATFDEYGRVRHEGAGGAFDRLVGAYPLNHFNAQFESRAVNGLPVAGQFSELEPTDGEVTARFDDGRPAAMRHALGAGSVQYVACEVASRCFQPGNTAWEEWLAQMVTTGAARPWRCEGAVAFRRRHARADHYFLVNEGDGRDVVIEAGDASYASAHDVMGERDVTTEPRGAGSLVRAHVPARLGLWVRCTGRREHGEHADL